MEESDRPPVGEPLVASRRNPDAKPAVHARTDDTVVREPTAAAPDEEPPPAGDLDGRVALVTAATGELGSALAAELVERGARVLLVDDDLIALIEAVDGIGAGGRAVPLRCDLDSGDDVESMCEFVSRAVGVDIVVHVADEPGGRDLLSEISAPVGLVSGLAGSLDGDARVVLVDRSDEPGADAGRHSCARDVVHDHVTRTHDVRVARASCGHDVAPRLFASTLVDLIGSDDLPLDRLVLDGGAVGTGAGDVDEVPFSSGNEA